MSSIKLGEVLTEKEGRDAAHVACQPAIAAHPLAAGIHIGIVGMTEDGEVIMGNDAAERVAIVDPFIRGYIAKGERFWACFYPETVEVLRHAWTHPALRAVERQVEEKKVSQLQIDEAKAYLLKFGKELLSDSYWDRDRDDEEEEIVTEFNTVEDVVKRLEQFMAGKGLNYDDALISMNDHSDIPEWFHEKTMWKHYETVTGKKPRVGYGLMSFCC